MHLVQATDRLIYEAQRLGLRDATFTMLVAAARMWLRYHDNLSGFVDRALRARLRARHLEDQEAA